MLLFIGAVLILVGLFALIRPNSQLFAGGRHGMFRTANRWQYEDDDGPERSPGGRALVRIIGGMFVVVGVGLIVSGIGSL